MKPRRPDPLPKIRIQLGGDDLKKLTGGTRRQPQVPAKGPPESSVADAKSRPRPSNEN